VLCSINSDIDSLSVNLFNAKVHYECSELRLFQEMFFTTSITSSSTNLNREFFIRFTISLAPKMKLLYSTSKSVSANLLAMVKLLLVTEIIATVFQKPDVSFLYSPST
jgi:hypothetical protein